MSVGVYVCGGGGGRGREKEREILLKEWDAEKKNCGQHVISSPNMVLYTYGSSISINSISLPSI